MTVAQNADASQTPSVWLDGELQGDNTIPLAGDRAVHAVEVRVGAASGA